MDVFEALSALTTAPGVTGNEVAVSEVVKGYYKAYTDDIFIDPMGNTYARIGDHGPVLLVQAHMDEVGMMVTGIEKDGLLRIRSVSGVDPRVLPGSEVLVHGKKVLNAVVGAIPPHLQQAGDDTKPYSIDDMVCDTGLDADEVNELVRVGDNVTFDLLPPMKLKNNIVAGKTFDDRACVTVMLEAMDLLKKTKLDCRVVFCATVQEESGGGGARASVWNVKPDMAIAMDVCHAPTPGIKPFDAIDIGKVSITCGPNIHPKMFKMITEAADEQNIPWDYDVAPAHTGTDAWDTQIQMGGVATGLISLPLRYMHTSVEEISLTTLKNCAKVIARFAQNIGADWEEKLCLDD